MSPRSPTNPVRRLCWAAVVLGALAAVGVAAMLWANAVDTDVSDGDRQIIADLDVDDACQEVAGFDAEIHCVQQVQSAIFERYPDTSDAFKKGATHHRVVDYDRRGFGSCYDRAKLVEQALRHYGFDVRRVALYEGQPTPLHYLVPGINSHALSEVRTSNGWMVVESVDPLVGVDAEQEVYDIARLREGIDDGSVDDETFGIEIPHNFFDGDFAYIYGVYSRHGYFFEPHLPVPEVDWASFGR